jgi:UDP-N-acetylglucosamine:LPS N-acetylglucosamine transferase
MNSSQGATAAISTKAAKEASFVFYALGGGMGHIVRAVSIARAIRKRLGIDPTIIASSAFSFLLKKKYFRFEIIEPGGDGDLYREKILSAYP